MNQIHSIATRVVDRLLRVDSYMGKGDQVRWYRTCTLDSVRNAESAGGTFAAEGRRLRKAAHLRREPPRRTSASPT